jgi:type I restriction enzyme R subunit
MSGSINKKARTEEDIKRLYITPAIESKWDKDAQIRMEYCFTDGRVIVRGSVTARGKKKKADYILYYKPNLPLAIVEAKDNNHSLGDGLQQGIDYASILDIPFAYSSNGDAFLEHDMKRGTEREIALEDFPTPEELWKRYTEEKRWSPEEVKLIIEPYHTQIGGIKPRYYQRVAINRTIEAIAGGQNRILLVMATGTGKTYTAFQIIHRLWKSGKKKKILFLADRNFLIDQTMQQDFKPFEKIMKKVSGKKLDSAYELYLSLYHQLAGDDLNEPFRQFKPNFFDLIVVDECHRGSAKEDSLWRKILEYFKSATQIGMTATPKETKYISNTHYFGEPIYIYSLKQGIEDGFLAPYKVHRILIDKDAQGWRPPVGKRDMYGNEIEDKEYGVKDFDRTLVIDDRTKVAAKRISDFLRNTNRYDKTIVFCVGVSHAERMRQALTNENSDLSAIDPKYVMRITGDNEEGKAQIDNFISEDSRYPVIVTTSRLLSTGADCKTCKLIVIDNVINSMTEFKQIIGRGTRLKPEYGKEFFTIMDFRGASRLFADPDFDGDPVPEDFESTEPKGTPTEPPSESPVKYRVNDVDVAILNEIVQYLDKDGKLIIESVKDYSKKNILGGYATLDEFLQAWNACERKEAIIEELKERDVLLDALREAAGGMDIDDFDLICHIAFDKKPLTKAERAAGVRKRGYLEKYKGVARDVLSALLDKYAVNGIADLEEISVLQIDPFRSMGDLKKLIDAFGEKQDYLAAVRELQSQIYTAA